MTTNGGDKTAEKPLRGVVLCCTSILPEQRAHYADIAASMGADNKLDLTSDVTHLLVGDSNTPKYKYVAREREDVKVLKPEWVEAVRDCWVKDQSFNLASLEEEYKYPIFGGLIICVTGFEDLTLRTQLQECVSENGGDYRGDLTKQVTHLIAFKPEGKKWQYANQWGLKVVTIQWLRDSLERGLILEESAYHPMLPIEEQGKNAWNRAAKAVRQVQKRAREEQVVPDVPRKLRRTASAKLGSQTDTLWADIAGGAASKEVPVQHGLKAAASLPSIRQQLPQVQVGDSMLEGSTAINGQNTPMELPGPPVVTKLLEPHAGILSGKAIYIHKFDPNKADKARLILASEGAFLCDSFEELVTVDQPFSDRFVFMQHTYDQSHLPLSLEKSTTIKAVTDMWLEKCLETKRCIDPNEYPLASPMRRVPIAEFEGLKVHATGLQGMEIMHTQRVIRLLGAQYSENFDSSVSLLICKGEESSRAKVHYAKEWNITPVDLKWLWSCLKKGVLEKGGIQEPLLQRKEKTASVQMTADHEKQLEKHKRSRQNRPFMDEDLDIGTNGTAAIDYDGLTKSNSIIAQPKDVSVGLDGVAEINDGHGTGKKLASEHVKRLDETVRENPTSSTRNNSIPRVTDDILRVKNKPRRDNDSNTTARDRSKKLLSRVLSNMSAGSKESGKGPLSRATSVGSVDSANTDGLGSEIALGGSRISTAAPPHRGDMYIPNHASAPSAISVYDPQELLPDLSAQDAVPPLTQLGYADSEEALALRARIEDMKRTTAGLPEDPSTKVPPPEPRRLKDDEALLGTGWGAGRRTRGNAQGPKGLEKF